MSSSEVILVTALRTDQEVWAPWGKGMWQEAQGCLQEEDAEVFFVIELHKFSTVFVYSSRLSTEGTLGKGGRGVNL